MSVSVEDFVTARESVAMLLETLRLSMYRFELALDDEEEWVLSVECQAPDGWQTARLQLSQRELEAASRDGEARSRLLAVMDERLDGCRRPARAGVAV
jgi:hypothetical protein